MSKTIVFVDWRLGLLKFALMGGLMGGCAILMATSAYIEPVQTPTIQYWFDGEIDMEAAVVAGETTSPTYCNNPEYNYYYCQDSGCSHTCPGRLSHSFYSSDEMCPDPRWDAVDILCRPYSMAEVVRKTGNEGFVFTLLKEHSIQKKACSTANFTCPARASTQRQWWSQEGATCSCETLQDFFVTGVEKLTMTFQHGFGTSPMLDTEHAGKQKNWRGKSSISKGDSKSGEKRIHTTVYKNCPQGVSFDNPDHSFDKCEKVEAIKPGENVGFSVEKWLEIAGTGLDDRVSSTDVISMKEELLPVRRIVGVNLQIVITYRGRTDNSEDFDAAVQVKIQSSSWSSFGHFVSYVVNRGIGAGSVEQDFVDSFARGVRFNFSSEGFIRRFDWFTAISYFITLVLLLINVVPAILKFAAFNWPRDLRSPVYEKATNEKFSFGGALASFGAQTAMAKEFASAFTSDASGYINRVNFEAQLAKNFTPFSAAAITDCIFAGVAIQVFTGDDTSSSGNVAEEFVTKEDIMRIFTNETFDMQDLLKKSFGGHDEFPPPETMNISELRAISSMNDVTVPDEDDDLHKYPSRLSLGEAERAKAAYLNALAPVFSKLKIAKTDEKQAFVKIRVPQGSEVRQQQCSYPTLFSPHFFFLLFFVFSKTINWCPQPGAMISFTPPGGGKLVQFALPANKKPGDLITVAVPKEGLDATL